MQDSIGEEDDNAEAILMRVSRTCPAVHASYTPATLTCFAHAPSVGHGMRIRQAFAPDLLATLLVLIPALVPTVSLLAGPPLPIPSRHHARGRFELGHHLLSPVNVQPVTGEGKWDGPWVFPSPGSSWRTSSSARFRPDFAPGVVVLLKVKKVLTGAKKKRGPAFAGPLRVLIAAAISARIRSESRDSVG